MLMITESDTGLCTLGPHVQGSVSLSTILPWALEADSCRLLDATSGTLRSWRGPGSGPFRITATGQPSARYPARDLVSGLVTGPRRVRASSPNRSCSSRFEHGVHHRVAAAGPDGAEDHIPDAVRPVPSCPAEPGSAAMRWKTGMSIVGLDELPVTW